MRERIYLYYFLYQGILFVFMMTYTGLAFTLLPFLADNTYYLMSYLQFELLLLLTIAVSSFYGEFLGLKANFPYGFLSLRLIQMTGIVLVPALALLNLGAAALLTVTYLGVSVLFGMLYYIPLAHLRHVYYFILSFIDLGVSVILHLLSVLGMMPGGFFADFMFGFGGVWEAIFLSLAIGDRINTMRAERKTINDAIFDKKALSGLNQVLGGSFARNYVPREWNVSIVFIDIAGFSSITEKIPAETLYSQLSREMREIAHIVKRHNGTIDRSLGDGFLCYFGYETISTPKRHARDAYQAAMEIQLRSIENILSKPPEEQVVFPLCIGIYAADVLVANLSPDNSNDFTMIGSGVNLASRLNAACNPFRILVSEKFKSILDESGGSNEEFHEIFVSIKHQQELIKAYECNPLFSHLERLAMVEKIYLEMMGYSRKEGRYRIEGPTVVQLASSHGHFIAYDFSMGGLGMRGETLICRKSLISLEVICENQRVMAPLVASMLHKIQAEVRWCRCVEGHYEHGVRFIGLNDEQKEIIFHFFSALFAPNQLTQKPEVA